MSRLKFVFVQLLIVPTILTFSFQKSFAQRDKYNLLWEISGNDLPKPSYLFGTMHVDDEGVFEFCDSMMICYQNCEALATEVHFDSLINEIINTQRMGSLQLLWEDDDFDNPFYFRKKVNASFFYEKKTKDLVRKVLIDTKKKKNTFLDAWLFNLAMLDGKHRYGLETMETYRDVYDKSIKLDFQDTIQHKTKKKSLGVSEMLKLYLAGNVDTIFNRAVQTMGHKVKRRVLDLRNEIMVERMEQRMKSQSLFTAIGAAHLGGEMGVINLLRKKGFVLRPITPEFTGVCHKYKPAKSPEEFIVSYTHPKHNYTVTFPGYPTPLDIKGAEGTHPVGFLDWGQNSFFISLANPAASYKGNLELVVEDHINEVVNDLSSGTKLELQKKMVNDSLAEVWFIAQKSKKFQDVYVTRRDLLTEYGLFIQIVATQDSTFSQPNIKKYFDSFVYRPLPDMNDSLFGLWKRHSYKSLGISLLSPSLLQKMPREEAEATEMYSLVDGKMEFFVSTMMSEPQKDTINLYDIEKYLLLALSTDEDMTKDTIEVDGQRATISIVEVEGMACSVMILSKGRMTYMLLVSDTTSYGKHFLNSLKFEQAKEPTIFPNMEKPTIRSLSKSPFFIKEEVEENENQKIFQKSVILIHPDFGADVRYKYSFLTLNELIYINDPKVFINKALKEDGIRKEDLVLSTWDKMNGKDVLVLKYKSADSLYFTKEMIFLSNEEMLCRAAADYPIDKQIETDNFFNTFVSLNQPLSSKHKNYDSALGKFKADLLEEKTSYSYSLIAPYFQFESPSDVEKLLLELAQEYASPKNKNKSYRFNYILSSLSEQLDINSFINLHKQINDFEIKSSVLREIAELDTLPAKEYVINWLERKDFSDQLGFPYSFEFKDEATFESYYPRLRKLISTGNVYQQNQAILIVINNCNALQEDSRAILKKDFSLFDSLFTHYTNVYNAKKASKGGVDGTIERILNQCLRAQSIIEKPLSNKILLSLLEKSNGEIELEPARLILAQGGSITDELWNKFAFSTLYDLYHDTLEIVKASVPTRLLSQENAAHHIVSSDYEFGDDIPYEDIILVGKEEVLLDNKGGIYYLFVYKSKKTREEYPYIFSAGPFKNATDMGGYGRGSLMTFLDIKTKDYKNDAKEQILELLKK